MVQAESQTAGRGRKNRSWESPPGNLYFSLCTYKEDLLPLKASIAVAKTLEDMNIEPRLKWPNDVLVEKKKICGILTEVVEDKGIVGIGLNVEEAPIEDSLSISDLVDEKPSLDSIMKEIIRNFYGIDEVMKTYRDYCSTIGKKVKMKTISGETEGIVEDIDERGRIVLDNGERFVSGDVIHVEKGVDKSGFNGFH